MASGAHLAIAGETAAPPQFRATAPEQVSDYYHYNIGIEATTLGGGATLGWRFTDIFGASTGFDFFSYSDSVTINNIRYHGTVQLLTEPLTLDIYPWEGNSLHFGIGVLFNQNVLFGGASAISNRTYDIDGRRYRSSDVGHVNLGIDQNAVAPYLGVAGNLFYFDRAHHWAFTGEAGVAYLGPASVTLSRSGGLSGSNAVGHSIDRSLNSEVSKIRGYGDDFAWWPVLKLGLGYNF